MTSTGGANRPVERVRLRVFYEAIQDPGTMELLDKTSLFFSPSSTLVIYCNQVKSGVDLYGHKRDKKHKK